MTGQLFLAAGDAHTQPLEWVLTWVVLAGLVLLALVVEGTTPLLWLIGLSMLIGAVLMLRGNRRLGALLIAIGDGLFLGWAAPYLFGAVMDPLSIGEYVAAALFLVAGISVLVGVGAVFREEDDSSQRSLVPLAGAGMLVVGLAFSYAGVSRLLTDDIAPQRADMVLRTEELWYSVSDVTLGSGTLEFVIDNQDLNIHSFVIDKLAVSTTVPGGASRAVAFAAEPGRYVYYCDVPGHDQMKGVLTVQGDF